MTNLPGERLKQERSRQQLSEQEVANKLHLSLTYLRALEADNYEQLPEATFIKGYFRNYARLLGLPAQEVTDAFEALQAEQEPVVVAAPTSDQPLLPKRQLAWIIVALVLLLVLVAWWWPAPEAEPQQHQASQPSAQQTLAVEPSTSPAEASTAVVTTPTADTVTAATDVAAASDVVAGSAPVVAEEMTPEVPQTAELKVAFAADCWVEVTDAAGEALFKGTRGKGSVLSLSGQAPFALMFGNAAGVTSISVDGKSIDLPAAGAGEVVHLQAR